MLNKKPNQRITIAQMKQHPFFKSINWQRLERKQVPPPVLLTMDEDDVEKELVPEDEEEQFLNFNENKDDGQAGPSGEKLFEDNDYKEDN